MLTESSQGLFTFITTECFPSSGKYEDHEFLKAFSFINESFLQTHETNPQGSLRRTFQT